MYFRLLLNSAIHSVPCLSAPRSQDYRQKPASLASSGLEKITNKQTETRKNEERKRKNERGERDRGERAIEGKTGRETERQT